MNVSDVLKLLRQKIGLNPESIGTASIEKVVREQIKRSGSASVDEYIEKLNDSSDELKRLFEFVVIPETSFFRDRVPFLALQKHLERFTLKKRLERQLRILSVPCSTGEEPYSIAMVLFEMKLKKDQFLIYASDISERALQFARDARFSTYSFRGDDLDFKNKYFSSHDDLYILSKEVRDAVHFEYANILDDDFLKGHRPYDIIFCRNLLIYFDDNTKNRAIKSLSDNLSENGVIFVGHAEAAKISQSGFTSLDYPMAFAFAREGYAKEINESLNSDTQGKKTSFPSGQCSPQIIKVNPVTDIKKATESKIDNDIKERSNKQQEDGKLSKVKKLAEEGKFSEVVALCENLLSTGYESAEVYYLLGQAVDSIGDSLMAEEYFKKAIYLNPGFYEALTYLSHFFDRMGNHKKSADFRTRAERVKLRNSGESASWPDVLSS